MASEDTYQEMLRLEHKLQSEIESELFGRSVETFRFYRNDHPAHGMQQVDAMLINIAVSNRGEWSGGASVINLRENRMRIEALKLITDGLRRAAIKKQGGTR